MNNYSKSSFDFTILKQLIPLFNNYFPDVLFKMLVVNCSMFLKIAIKGLLNLTFSSTREKICILGEDKNEIKLELTKYHSNEIVL